MDLDLVRAAVPWPDHDFRDVASLAMVKCEIEIGCKCLVHGIIVFKDIFYNVVRLVDGVPSAVGVLMLHLEGKRHCHL